SAFYRYENAGTSSDKFPLVVRWQLHHRGVLVGISERCEDLPSHTKIGMTHVRRFNCLRKTQRQFAKFIWRHRIYDCSARAVVRSNTVCLRRRKSGNPNDTPTTNVPSVGNQRRRTRKRLPSL